jgi:Tol biopolymer transport system component
MNPKPIYLILALFCLACSEDKQVFPPQTSTENNQLFLYSSDRSGHNELFRFDKGEELLILSNPSYDYWWPKVSPDKSKVLFYRSVANPDKNHDDYVNAELMVMDIDGTDSKVLISIGQYGWLGQGVCRWNKDGTKILMATVQNTDFGEQWRLVITDAAGSNPKNLSDWWIIDPNFSTTNEEIVFIAFPNNELTFDLTKLELHKADYDAVDDTIVNIERLTSNETRDHDPSFDPDDSKIVFSAGNRDYTDVDIAIYDIGEQIETEVLNDSGSNGGSICWSLKGEEIYFHSLNLAKHPFQIKKVDLDSKNVKSLLKSSSNDFGYFHPETY